MVASIPKALEILKHGGIVIVTDDEDRENEGDFVCNADKCTPESVNFMATHGRGLICISMTQKRLAELSLPLMVQHNTARLATNFTVSVDAAENITTGISAGDRAETIHILCDPKAHPGDLARPGHIFPIGARNGGVLERAGHTEGSSDMARLSGSQPLGVMCEILNKDGSMARMPDLLKIAKKHDMPIVTIRDLIAYRVETERLVERVAETTLPNKYGMWNMYLYENKINGKVHTVLKMGEPEKQESALVRVHSQCFTGDTLGSLRCDCGPQLETAMERIAKEGHGILLYMAQEGRGIGLKNKIMAYALQDQGHDTVEANEALGFKPDLRNYGYGAQILRDMGLNNLRLMTNNPRKIVGLEAYGLRVVDRISIEVGCHAHNKRYLDTKKTKLGHILKRDTTKSEDTNNG